MKWFDGPGTLIGRHYVVRTIWVWQTPWFDNSIHEKDTLDYGIIFPFWIKNFGTFWSLHYVFNWQDCFWTACISHFSSPFWFLFFLLTPENQDYQRLRAPIIYFIEGRSPSRHKQRGFAVSKCLNGTFSWRKCFIKALVR